MKPRLYDNPLIEYETGRQYNIFWPDDLNGPQRAEAVRLFGAQALPHGEIIVLLPPEGWVPSSC